MKHNSQSLSHRGNVLEPSIKKPPAESRGKT
jgi:hypothetical protein